MIVVKEVVQIIEPWDAEHPYSEYTRKPIIGLAPECYGSLVIPLYEKGENPLRDKSQYRMVDWKMNKRKKIILLYMRLILQPMSKICMKEW